MDGREEVEIAAAAAAAHSSRVCVRWLFMIFFVRDDDAETSKISAPSHLYASCKCAFAVGSRRCAPKILIICGKKSIWTPQKRSDSTPNSGTIALAHSLSRSLIVTLFAMTSGRRRPASSMPTRLAIDAAIELC